MRSVLSRYLAAVTVFAVLLFMPFGLQRTFNFSFDTTFLIIIAMIASAWYFGRGPGLLIALLFEGALIYFSTAPFSTRSVIITFNRLLLFVAVVLFASARKSAEKNLREQRELLEVTLSSIADGVIATDSRGLINFVNPTAQLLTGITPIDAIGRPLRDVLELRNEEARRERSAPTANIGERSETKLIVAKSGKEIPVEYSVSPIVDGAGVRVGDVLALRDVTARRQAEEEREELLRSERDARNQAEAANRMKDEFLATVSHELRTPLNSILGWAAMLKESKPDTNGIEKGLSVIERNARAQNEIINDILDVSRIVTGKMNIEFKPVDIIPVLRSALDSLYPAARAKSIKINTSFDHKNPVVAGDPDRLQQVFWNLLSNAIKFTSNGGEIDIGASQKGQSIEVRFRDSGIGISQEFLPVVFDRFRQVDSSIRRMHGGLGLGLAIVRHLVELHGGTVSAESSGEGTGATFTVSLPTAVSAGKANGTKEIGRERPDLTGLRVLIVDDHPDTVEMFCLSLETFGAATRAATSCREAVEVFNEWRPDVLLSDLGMPGEDGFDLISRIRAFGAEKGGDIPAAAITAYTREKDRLDALSAGFQTHVAKPISAEELASVVAKLARN